MYEIRSLMSEEGNSWTHTV